MKKVIEIEVTIEIENEVEITASTLHTNNKLKKTLTISIPSGPQPIDVIVEPMQQICDAFIELELTASPASCKAGCSVCCNQLIPLSGVEVLQLQKVLTSLPRKVRRKVSASLRSMQEKSEKIIASSYSGSTPFEEQYFNLGKPCSFLVDNNCSIYQQRPLVCREYNVDTSPTLCKSPYHSPSLHRVARGLNMAAMLSAFSARLLRIDKMPIPMFLLENWGHDNPNTRATYDSRHLIKSLLDAIKVTTDKYPLYKAFSWHYNDESSDRANDGKNDAPHNENGHAIRAARQTKLIVPDKLPKLLVQHANALNIEKIVNLINSFTRPDTAEAPIIEIGAGSGYFRYLASLLDQPAITAFSDRIIETEQNQQVVTHNHQQGKQTLQLDVNQLVDEFGKNSAAIVLSMNVLDIFPLEAIKSVISNVTDVLLPGGLAVHVMSSSLHPAIFNELAAIHGNSVLLPYAKDHLLGVTLAEPCDMLAQEFPQFIERPNSLAQLSAQAPEQYINLACQVKTRLQQENISHLSLLLHEYSLQKIADQLQQQGFALLQKQLISSTIETIKNKFHQQIPEANFFINHLGSLTVDKRDNIAMSKVQEASTFGLVIARKLQ